MRRVLDSHGSGGGDRSRIQGRAAVWLRPRMQGRGTLRGIHKEPSGFERPAPVGEVPRGEDLSIADRGDLEVGRLDRCATQPALGPNGAGDKNLVTRLMNLVYLRLPVFP